MLMNSMKALKCIFYFLLKISFKFPNMAATVQMSQSVVKGIAVLQILYLFILLIAHST